MMMMDAPEHTKVLVTSRSSMQASVTVANADSLNRTPAVLFITFVTAVLFITFVNATRTS